MVRRSKKDDDYIGPSRGLVGLFHKFMMLLLFPLRKPLWFLLIVTVLFLAPTFHGVKPAEVHLWYWKHVSELSSLISEPFDGNPRNAASEPKDTKQPVETTVSADNAPSSETLNQKAREPQLISQPPRKVHRQIFGRAEKTSAQPAVKTTIKPVVQQKRLPNLRYLSVSEDISGIPTVINANEIRIAGQTMFLYGIFVQPASQKGIDGALYLRRLIEDKTVECKINAYTHQNIATAICYLEGVCLNRRMVELGYSQNVALD